MAKTITLKPETTDVWVGLNLAHRTLTRQFDQALRRAGLPSAPWYDVLWALERHPEGLRQYELQRHCLYDQPNLSRSLKRMIDEGLVTTLRAQTDRRGRVLRLTENGQDLRARMWVIYGGLMKTLIENRLSPEEAAQLVQALAPLCPPNDPRAPGC